ncbi:MAG: hypothetical protein KAU95_02000 [Candidatus Aenigmarchaeota archaeon]|nr:hypothetical protein [Candidatus Aenigmarchaeota archaeon]
MKDKLIYSLILIIAVLFVYFIGGPVIIFASLFVIFDKCVFSRVNVIPGPESVTFTTVLVTLAYGWEIGLLFCFFVPMLIPMLINNFIGEKGVINKDFTLAGFGIGNIIDLVCVLIVYSLRILDIFWIMLIIIVFKHATNSIASALKTVNYVPDYFGIILNSLFNLSLVFLFHSFWLQMIV